MSAWTNVYLISLTKKEQKQSYFYQKVTKRKGKTLEWTCSAGLELELSLQNHSVFTEINTDVNVNVYMCVHKNIP